MISGPMPSPWATVIGVGVRVASEADFVAETWTFIRVSSFQREYFETGLRVDETLCRRCLAARTVI